MIHRTITTLVILIASVTHAQNRIASDGDLGSWCAAVMSSAWSNSLLWATLDRNTLTDTNSYTEDFSAASPHNNPSNNIVASIPVWTNGAMSFSGVDDYLKTPLLVPATNRVSVAAWIKTTNRTISAVMGTVATGSAGIMSWYHASANASASSTNYMCLQLRNAVVGSNQVTIAANCGAVIHDGAWHHVAIVNTDGTNGAAYVDGVTVSTSGNPAPLSPLLSIAVPTYPLTVGARNLRGVIDLYFNGEIDEPVYCLSPLTSNEVRSLWMSGKDGHQ